MPLRSAISALNDAARSPQRFIRVPGRTRPSCSPAPASPIRRTSSGSCALRATLGTLRARPPETSRRRCGYQNRVGGYPFFVQQYARAAWNAGVRASIEQTFYRDALEGLSPRERAFVIALAELGPGPHELKRFDPHATHQEERRVLAPSRNDSISNSARRSIHQ
jgi:hypothetical protein